MENQIPSIRKLYFHDFVIKFSIHLIFGSLIFLAGMYWADPSTISILPYVAPPITALGIIILAYRYWSVTSILKDGITVKGKVDALNVHETREERVSGSLFKGKKRYAYYINISYAVAGETYKKRIRLPGSGFMYGIHDKHEIDLMLKETSPHNVLIKNVYFNRLH